MSKDFSKRMNDPDPNAHIPSIHEHRGWMADKELTEEQVGAAELQAETLGPALNNVLMRIDTLNNEVAALSYLSNEAWRLAFKAGENPATDEHAFYLAPIVRRICYLSEQVSGLLSGIGIDSAADPRYKAAL